MLGDGGDPRSREVERCGPDKVFGGRNSQGGVSCRQSSSSILSDDELQGTPDTYSDTFVVRR